LEHCGKKTVASGLVFFVSVTAAAVFMACGTPKPAVQQLPKAPLIEMLSIPGGTFRMGSTRETGLLNETPAHQVTLHDFLLGQYEITQGQYFDVTGQRPSSCKTNPELRGPEGWKTLPVEMVSWYEALIFCNKLSMMENLKPAYRVNGHTNPNDWGAVPTDEAATPWHVEWIHSANGFRLPTEAEWEYAARGGVNTANRYAGSNNADDVAWYYENSETMSHGIGKKAPNELELYDMSGNVMEWCWDWQGAYTAAAKENPRGASSSLYKIIRGGSWSYAVNYCNVAYRHYNYPYYRGVNLGFRVVRSE
jgi:formylglycine-generating enzyme required for sulfatase activity